ncbi:hypothetical protein CSP16_002098 [Salmonella enterica subsp. arizonae]|uniref:Uncharacterized protein n=1 Tax=Salmonella enterica TaxID=28901 RepID=A0A5T6MSB1_SALER|nr:hypothetical protein [Salmonella enterica]ECC1651612.1 hypothetical protein [Salmonella enterica subsp. arizonae]ECC9544954.1 hypothetical protein [Salmonella enterica subsp. arizonae]ECG8635517.1 hypothetical protein [Salmonella enterica subsp. arizonae]EDH0993898.1 hypothetical protein [Salmonella enterica]
MLRGELPLWRMGIADNLNLANAVNTGVAALTLHKVRRWTVAVPAVSVLSLYDNLVSPVSWSGNTRRYRALRL